MVLVVQDAIAELGHTRAWGGGVDQDADSGEPVLLAERERVVNSLQELDSDFQLGKVPEEDYPTQRANLLQKGADILRKLDELAPVKAQNDKDARVERALEARRKNRSNHKGELTDDDVESMIAARRKGRKAKSVGFCPKCGKPVMASDKFCPSCGKTLA